MSNSTISKMKIGIVNTGYLSLNFAVAWIRCGHQVMLSKDTHPEQLRERVRAFGLDRGINDSELAQFKYGSLADAAKFGDVVIMSPYFPRLAHVLEELHSSDVTLSGKIVIDTMNPLQIDANMKHYHDLEYMQKSSTTEELQREFPEAILFKAFNTTPAALLDERKWTTGRVPAVMFLGGNPSSTDTVRKLIEDVGFRPHFAGHNLTDARLLESLVRLLHRVDENEYDGNLNITFDIIGYGV